MQKLNMVRAALLIGALSVPLAMPTSAQVVVGGGLVNVQIGAIDVETGDILSENTVQVGVNAAAQIAAQICGLSVNVIATQIANDVPVNCTADQRAGEQVVRFVSIP